MLGGMETVMMMIIMRDAIEAGTKIGIAMVMEGKENMTIELMTLGGILTQIYVIEINIGEMVKNAMEKIVPGMVIVGDEEVLMITDMVQERIKIMIMMTMHGMYHVLSNYSFTIM